jgi:hypothetical protein
MPTSENKIAEHHDCLATPWKSLGYLISQRPRLAQALVTLPHDVSPEPWGDFNYWMPKEQHQDAIRPSSLKATHRSCMAAEPTPLSHDICVCMGDEKHCILIEGVSFSDFFDEDGYGNLCMWQHIRDGGQKKSRVQSSTYEPTFLEVLAGSGRGQAVHPQLLRCSRCDVEEAENNLRNPIVEPTKNLNTRVG